jgi:hypothetical protein
MRKIFFPLIVLTQLSVSIALLVGPRLILSQRFIASEESPHPVSLTQEDQVWITAVHEIRKRQNPMIILLLFTSIALVALSVTEKRKE